MKGGNNMKKEDIEKAAGEYSGSILGFKDNPHVMKTHKAFADGAQWAINSVWHDMETEVPQVYGEYKDSIYPQIPCLVVGHLSTGYGYGVRYWNATQQCWDDEECDDYECGKDKIEEWAYLDDLLPERKEETE